MTGNKLYLAGHKLYLTPNKLYQTGASKNDYIVLNGTVRFLMLWMFLGEMVSQYLVSCRNDFYHIVSWIFWRKKLWIGKPH